MSEDNTPKRSMVRISSFPAAKGNLQVDGNDLTISENSTTRFRLILTHWERTNSGPQQYAKIVKLTKPRLGPVEKEVQAHGPVEIGLDQDALNQLFSLVSAHREAIGQKISGNFLVVPIADNEFSAKPEDKQTLVDIVAKLVSDPDLLRHLAQNPSLRAQLQSFTVVAKLEEIKDARNALVELVAEDAVESELNAWCKDNAWAFGFICFEDVHSISNQDSLDLIAMNPTSPMGIRLTTATTKYR